MQPSHMYTIRKLTPDGHTNMEMFKLRPDRKNIGQVVTASCVIVYHRMSLRLSFPFRQELRERFQNPCQRFARRPYEGSLRVEFVYPSCPF